MWLGKNISEQKSNAGSEAAYITSASGAAVSASAYSGEYRDIPVFSNFGYMGKPFDNSTALVIPFEDTGACVGYLSNDYNLLSQGEILIKAPSGAFIKLCADGTVNINGTIFAQKGTLN